MNQVISLRSNNCENMLHTPPNLPHTYAKLNQNLTMPPPSTKNVHDVDCYMMMWSFVHGSGCCLTPTKNLHHGHNEAGKIQFAPKKLHGSQLVFLLLRAVETLSCRLSRLSIGKRHSITIMFLTMPEISVQFMPKTSNLRNPWANNDQ